MPVIPPTWKAEAGESLEPRRWRLQQAKIAPLHSSLSDRESVSKTNKKRFNKIMCLKYFAKHLANPSISLIRFSFHFSLHSHFVFLFFETESHPAAHAGVYWHKLGSLQPYSAGLK